MSTILSSIVSLVYRVEVSEGGRLNSYSIHLHVKYHFLRRNEEKYDTTIESLFKQGQGSV